LVVAWAGALAIGWLGQSVNMPGRTCICSGKGIMVGVPAKAVAVNNQAAIPEIRDFIVKSEDFYLIHLCPRGNQAFFGSKRVEGTSSASICILKSERRHSCPQ